MPKRTGSLRRGRSSTRLVEPCGCVIFYHPRSKWCDHEISWFRRVTHRKRDTYTQAEARRILGMSQSHASEVFNFKRRVSR